MPEPEIVPEEKKVVSASETSAAEVKKAVAGERRTGPYIIVRHRIPEGTIRHGDRIPRYWKSKLNGETVEIRRYLNVMPEGTKRVVFFDQTVDQELSCTFQEFVRDFEPVGNMSSKF